LSFIDILNSKGVTFSSPRKAREFNKRIQQYDTNNNGEEIMAIASEMMVDGDIKFKDGPVQKIRDVFRRFTNNQIGRDIKFDNNNDVKNFMKRNDEYFDTSGSKQSKQTYIKRQAEFTWAMQKEIDDYRDQNQGQEPERDWINTKANALFIDIEIDGSGVFYPDEEKLFQKTGKGQEKIEVIGDDGKTKVEYTHGTKKEDKKLPGDFHPEFIEHARKVYRQGFVDQDPGKFSPKNVFGSSSKASYEYRRHLKMPDDYLIDLWESYTREPEPTYTGPLLKRE